jgi:hypothetical protein
MRVQNGQLVVTQINGGTDGTDTVANVEMLRFAGTVDTSPSATIDRLYEAVLGRAADAGGKADWLSAIDGGATMHDVAMGLVMSPEAQQFRGSMSDTQYVEMLYQEILGREADTGGRDSWVGALQSGGQDRAGILLEFINSAENLAAEPSVPVTVDFNQTDVASLVRLYDTVLARSPDEPGLNHWLSLTEGGMSMGQVADFLLVSQEAQDIYGPMNDGQFIGMLYQNALGRSGSADEIASWTTALSNGSVDRGDVLLGFANSPEKIELMGVINTTIETI